MPRMGSGPVREVPVPKDLQQYYNVKFFTETIHGRGRGAHLRKRPRPPRHMHGTGRHHPDVWGNRGAIHQG